MARGKTSYNGAVATVVFVSLFVMAGFVGGFIGNAGVSQHSGNKVVNATSSSGSGNMNLLTDLGNGNTLLMGSVGVNLPDAINPLYTHGPAVQISPISASSVDVAVGQAVIMSVHGISGLPPYTYSWNLGNGNTASGNAVTATYSSPGTYEVQATVQDQALNTASSYTNISVHPALSISVSPSSTTILGGQEVNFAWLITGGVTNQWGNYPSLLINWGDQFSSPVALTNVSASGSYAHEYIVNYTGVPGVYTSVFTVTDNIGEVASATSQVTVNQLPYSLSIAANATKFFANQPYTFYFNVTGGSGFNNYSVFWGDGTSTSVPGYPPYFLFSAPDNIVISHTYTSPGNYIILASANSSAFNEAGAMFTLTVNVNKLSSSLLLFAHPNAMTWTALPSTYTENVSTAISTPIAINATVAGGFASYSYALISASGPTVASGSFSNAVLYPGQTVYTFTSTTPGTYIYVLKVTDSTGNTVYSNDVTIIITGQSLMPVVQPSHLVGFAPLREYFALSLYNVQFNSSGEALIFWSLYLGSGAGTKTGSHTFYGTPGSFKNEVNFRSVSFVYNVPGTYGVQLSANYSGNATIATGSVVDITVNAAQPFSYTSFGSIPSPAIGVAPFAVQYWVNVTGEIGEYWLSINTGDSPLAYLLASSLSPSISLIGNIYTPTIENYNGTAWVYNINSAGEPYFNFTYTIVYPNPSNPAFIFAQTANAYTPSRSVVTMTLPTIDVIVKPAQPLFVQLFASQTKIEAGMSVAFSVTISGGDAPYNWFFTPDDINAFGGIFSTSVANAPLYFANGTAFASAQNNTFAYAASGIYTAILYVYPSSFFLAPPAMAYLVTIDVVPAVSASISYTPSTGLFAPVSVAFLGTASGGQAPYTYTWSVLGMSASGQSVVGNFGSPGYYTVSLNVTDTLGFYDNVSTIVHIRASPNVYQVVSARMQVTLAPMSGGPTYIALAGPASWDINGNLNGSFMMPNVPALNAQYMVNVTYGYTVAVTQFHSDHLFIWYDDGYQSIGVWETYFYDAYGPGGISSTLTVVAGGQVTGSTSGELATLTALINGVNTNLSVDTSSLLSAMQSGFKTVNNGIVTIQTQGSQIQASLSAINATVLSLGSNFVNIQTSIGVIQTKLNDINANLTSVSNGMGTLQTDLGKIQVSLNAVNASIKSVDGNVITLQTALGTVQATLSSINGTVTSTSTSVNGLVGSMVTIKSDVGSVSGQITAVNAGYATVQTALGNLSVKVSDIQTKVSALSSQLNNSLLWSYVAALLALITLVVAAVVLVRVSRMRRKL